MGIIVAGLIQTICVCMGFPWEKRGNRAYYKYKYWDL